MGLECRHQRMEENMKFTNQKTKITNQLRGLGFTPKEIKHFNNLLNYRGVKFTNVKFVACCVNTNTIRFYTNIDSMIIEFAM